MHPVLPSVHPHISLTVDPSGQTPIKSKGVDQRAIFMCSRPSYFSFIWGRTLSAKISPLLESILPAQARTRRYFGACLLQQQQKHVSPWEWPGRISLVATGGCKNSTFIFIASGGFFLCHFLIFG